MKPLTLKKGASSLPSWLKLRGHRSGGRRPLVTRVAPPVADRAGTALSERYGPLGSSARVIGECKLVTMGVTSV